MPDDAPDERTEKRCRSARGNNAVRATHGHRGSHAPGADLDQLRLERDQIQWQRGEGHDRPTSWHKRASTAWLDSRGGAQFASFAASNTRHASCVRVAMVNPRRPLKRDIERQLRFGPIVRAAPIVVSANLDAASLLDAIDLHGGTYPAWEVSRVGSATTTAQDAAVRLFIEHTRSHSPATEFAVSDPVRAPRGIGLHLHDGSVTLEGQITWNYRRDAERAIQYLSNAIGVPALEPQCPVSFVKENVEHALKWLSMDGSKE